jgi:hypothetical protein
LWAPEENHEGVNRQGSQALEDDEEKQRMMRIAAAQLDWFTNLTFGVTTSNTSPSSSAARCRKPRLSGAWIRYAHAMGKVFAGVEYFAAGLVGLVVAFLLTGLVSIAIFPQDGPLGEGFAIIFIYLIVVCACVPGYVTLMSLHRQGRRYTKGLIACEMILRASFFAAACFIGFMAIKLPTSIVTKWITCFIVAPFGAWAIRPFSIT